MSFCLVSYLFHPPFWQFPETGYNNLSWLLKTCIFLLKCAFSSFGQTLLRMNVPPDDPGCSHLLDAQQPLRLVLAAASPFFLPSLSCSADRPRTWWATETQQLLQKLFLKVFFPVSAWILFMCPFSNYRPVLYSFLVPSFKENKQICLMLWKMFS